MFSVPALGQLHGSGRFRLRTNPNIRLKLAKIALILRESGTRQRFPPKAQTPIIAQAISTAGGPGNGPDIANWRAVRNHKFAGLTEGASTPDALAHVRNSQVQRTAGEANQTFPPM